MADIDNFRQWADRYWPGLNTALLQPPTVSVRRNPAKPGPLTLQPDGAVEWCDEGFYLAGRPNFTLDPHMHQGRYYVQDASSMVVGSIAALLARQPGMPAVRPLMYLDACAAPGGKTTAAIAALPESTIVFANEFDYRRANILVENLAKWGATRTVVTRGDTARYSQLASIFDIIAVDAPCSGEGMMRKDPAAVAQWSPRLVAECADRQQEILARLWPALRPGGYLIYSTCTFNMVENEQVSQQFATATGARFTELPLDRYAGVAVNGTHYRFMPGRVRGEGLCVCVMQKPCSPDDTGQPGKSKKSRKPGNQKAGGKVTLPQPFADAMPTDAVLSKNDEGIVTAIEADMAAAVAPMLPRLDVLAAGVTAGQVKGRDFIPSQALAMSRWLTAPPGIPTHDVDHDTALAYLRRDAIVLPAGAPRDFVLLTHDGYPLGWVKNLGSRSNNLYPAPWRILHA